MRILLDAYSTAYSEHDYDKAIVELDIESAKTLLQHANLFKVLNESWSSLTGITFTSTVCRFYDGLDLLHGNEELLSSGELDTLNGYGWIVLPDTFKEPIDKKLSKAEAVIFLGVCKDGFYWTAQMLEYEEVVETSVLKREVLNQLL